MAFLTEIYSMRYDELLLRRCTAACTVKAEAISDEEETTPNHAARKAWADATFKDPIAETQKLMWRIVQNPTLQSKQDAASIAGGGVATDQDIQFVVNGVVDDAIVD